MSTAQPPLPLPEYPALSAGQPHSQGAAVAALAVAGAAVSTCTLCGAPAVIGYETRRLPCSHMAFRTRTGVAVFWDNTVDMLLNLDRASGSERESHWELATESAEVCHGA